MKEAIKRVFVSAATTALLLPVLVLSTSQASARSAGAQQSDAAQNVSGQSGQPADPIRQLNLTPDQVEKIRAIREQNKAERQAVNQRLRKAQVALEQAIDSDTSTEAMIEERTRELGEAQAASARMRALTEVRIRRVLTPEQLATLRRLRFEAREVKRLENGNQRQRARERMERRGNAPAQRDGKGLTPRGRRP